MSVGLPLARRVRTPLQYPLPAALPRRPEQAFAALSRLPGAFWLDSGDARRPHATVHHLGFGPSERIAPDTRHADPFLALDRLLDRSTGFTAPALPAPRLVGWLSYDLGRFLERVPTPANGALEPEMHFGVYDATVSYDLSGRAWITAGSPAAAATLEAALRGPRAPARRGPLARTGPTTPIDRRRWADPIRRIREYIAAGHVYQVNLSHRFEATLVPGASAADVYRRLRTAHPACYGAFLDAGDAAIVSNSPEGFLSVDLERRHVATWPLKGTRPAGADPAELRADPKERAEHVMIVDLERNDLGRIAVPGTVRVPRLLDVVRHPTVLHLESRVECEPRPDVGLVDVLRATFPGGSITGAPKIRAMEIIAELEQERRGIYCGALGQVGWSGARSTWSIPIRTAVLRGRELAFRSGGGIVADSDPDREYDETLVKARAFLELLQAA